MRGIALGISLGCAAHAGTLAYLLRRLGLWSLDAPFRDRLIRIGSATAMMSLGLMAATILMPRPGPMALTGLCLGGLALYAAAAWLTGAVARADVAALTKKS